MDYTVFLENFLESSNFASSNKQQYENSAEQRKKEEESAQRSSSFRCPILCGLRDYEREGRLTTVAEIGQ